MTDDELIFELRSELATKDRIIAKKCQEVEEGRLDRGRLFKYIKTLQHENIAYRRALKAVDAKLDNALKNTQQEES